MRRFQMMLDEELDAALAERAIRDGVSKAELLREYARDRLLTRPLRRTDPIWALCGSETGPDDEQDRFAGRVSEHVDDVLYGS
ncbi:MAG: CopG family transcriptional regulator [Pseudonocardiaceae bacterium]